MRTLLTAILALLSYTGFAGVYVFEGVYQGKDLYVRNPFSSDGVGFCVFEVKVNGEVTTDELNSNAFAIDLALFDFQVGDPIEVVIRTKDNCEPRVINPEDISPQSTFELESMELKSDQKLAFQTSNEEGIIPFVVEQFKWNKWLPVATIEGKGAHEGFNSYEIKVPVHAGENTYRIRQDDSKGAHLSERKSFQSTKNPIQIKEEKIYDKLEFTAETEYEVFDAFGVLKARGTGSELETSSWDKGTYYVNFDNRFGVSVNKK